MGLTLISFKSPNGGIVISYLYLLTILTGWRPGSPGVDQIRIQSESKQQMTRPPGRPASSARRRRTPCGPSTARASVAAPLRPRPSSAGRRTRTGTQVRPGTGSTRRARRVAPSACGGGAPPQSYRGAAVFIFIAPSTRTNSLLVFLFANLSAHRTNTEMERRKI